MAELERCDWAGSDPRMIAYHDTEWGTPLDDDRRLFEFLILEGAQAGLRWSTVLAKRDRYREVFDGFDPERVARYDEAKVGELLADPGIIRNRLKVASAISNARAYLELQAAEGSFGAWLWSFVDGRPVVNRFRRMAEVPAETDLSRTLSAELRRRGFNFVGPTICYAFMQAIGLVNDHLVGCFRWREVQARIEGR